MILHVVMFGLRGLSCRCGWKPPVPCSYIDDNDQLVLPRPYGYSEEVTLIHAHINAQKEA